MLKHIFVEGFLVVLVGLTLALGANAISPKGLALSRNYFPESSEPTKGAGGGRNQPSLQPSHPDGTNGVRDRLLAKGLQIADALAAKAAFDDPLRLQGLVIFIDARGDEAYAGGHIPGSLQLDYYHPEKYLPIVLPACTVAQRIIVYCNGGECEDSEFSALMLRDAGVAAEKIFVFGGGIVEWRQREWPVATGSSDGGANPGP